LLEYSKSEGKDDDADIAAPAAAVHADQHFAIDIDSFGSSRYRIDIGVSCVSAGAEMGHDAQVTDLHHTI